MNKNENQLGQVLAERGSRYGDFSVHAEIAQSIQIIMRGYGWYKLDHVQRQALTVIADKIARILSGDPNYDDNWIDIQGYAKLVQDRLPKQGELFDDVRIEGADERLIGAGNQFGYPDIKREGAGLPPTCGCP